MPQKRCDCCGAYLDYGERCDCGGVLPDMPAPAPIRQNRARAKPKPKHRKPPLRRIDPERAWQAFDAK